MDLNSNIYYYLRNEMSGDSLIFKVTNFNDRNKDSGSAKHCIYVVFDVFTDQYLICGKRMDLELSQPYSFISDTSYDVLNFIETIFDDEYGLLDVSLYNCNDLSSDIYELEYETFISLDEDYELITHKDVLFSDKLVQKLLSNLSRIYNVY
jgi:hypothetical protein